MGEDVGVLPFILLELTPDPWDELELGPPWKGCLARRALGG